MQNDHQFLKEELYYEAVEYDGNNNFIELLFFFFFNQDSVSCACREPEVRYNKFIYTLVHTLASAYKSIPYTYTEYNMH